MTNNYSKSLFLSREASNDALSGGCKAPIFVIHKHSATHISYILRLEIENTLKSWRLEKGPTLDPHDKIRAIQIEDCPLEFGNFEGVISQENPEAGVFLVWDKGNYHSATPSSNQPSSLDEDYQKGHLVILIHGQKLRGGFALQRLRQEGNQKWVFTKLKDQYVETDIDLTKNDTSVVSGRNLLEIEHEGKEKT